MVGGAVDNVRADGSTKSGLMASTAAATSDLTLVTQASHTANWSTSAAKLAIWPEPNSPPAAVRHSRMRSLVNVKSSSN